MGKKALSKNSFYVTPILSECQGGHDEEQYSVLGLPASGPLESRGKLAYSAHVNLVPFQIHPPTFWVDQFEMALSQTPGPVASSVPFQFLLRRTKTPAE